MAIAGNEPNPVIEKVTSLDTGSLVAVAGHPIHAMSVHFPIALAFATLGADLFYWYSGDAFWVRAALWSAGFAFGFGVLAGLAGTAEILFVAGIRKRAASWTHAVAAMTLLSILGLNWALRLEGGSEVVLPLGLLVSALGGVFTGLAGWHGGKLVFDHGIGLMISSDDKPLA